MDLTASQSENLRHLLREICERPTDDTPRLIYADFCEEFGDPERAEFIRVQCRLAECEVHGAGNTCFPPYCVICRPLRRRERGLFASDRIGKFLPREFDAYVTISRRDADEEFDGGDGSLGILRRGFVEEVRTTAEAWLAHGPAVVACQPVTRCVLTDVDIRSSYVEDSGKHVECVWQNRFPPAWWDYLDDPKTRTIPWHRVTVMTYDTPEEAKAATGRAALSWALAVVERGRG